ncbi:MAG: LytR/AlgR family response regulator transcription factor [Bacteroidales bacterium]
MNAIIIEDEKLSAEHLSNLIRKIDPGIRVLHVFDSVKQSVDAFNEGVTADLLFVDIHLADGLSFEIFNEIAIDTPVIFTTAYDEYAIRAFRLNSVDYLLKPIGIDELRTALEKYKKYNSKDHSMMIDNIVHAFQSIRKEYKSRFMVRIGETIVSVKSEEIANFIFEDGIVILTTQKNHHYPVDFTLEQLEPMLNPGEFFRINRKVIVNISAIQKTGTYFNSRLKITSAFLHDDNSIVSRERVNDFKEWLGK